MGENWWVYIIDKHGKLYVGITTDLENRMRQYGEVVHRLPLAYLSACSAQACTPWAQGDKSGEKRIYKYPQAHCRYEVGRGSLVCWLLYSEYMNMHLTYTHMHYRL
ncbi:MAG: hypothetical protein DRG63_10100 [Deltaproteobacteria bacterium]|nr:MAG: hypothetical protein DRG63_10100 [Deltaproteobacteria bacterium]